MTTPDPVCVSAYPDTPLPMSVGEGRFPFKAGDVIKSKVPTHDHPATFSRQLYPYLIAEMAGLGSVLDPLAGTGKIHEIAELAGVHTSIGMELEPEWANVDLFPRFPRIQVVGDSLAMLRGWKMVGEQVDAVVTSCCYGNRMGDHHNAKDGSRRNTYKHRLGRDLTEGSSAGMQWGKDYQWFHLKLWNETTQITNRIILNVKDHVRKGEVQPVSEWHRATIESLGFETVRDHHIVCPGNRHGANGKARVEFEHLYVFERVTP